MSSRWRKWYAGQVPTIHPVYYSINPTMIGLQAANMTCLDIVTCAGYTARLGNFNDYIIDFKSVRLSDTKCVDTRIDILK